MAVRKEGKSLPVEKDEECLCEGSAWCLALIKEPAGTWWWRRLTSHDQEGW